MKSTNVNGEPQFHQFFNQPVIVAPVGVRVGPLFAAGFFLMIFSWAAVQPETFLRQSRLMCAGSLLFAAASIYAAITASFWKVEFSEASLSLTTIYSKKTIAWDSIANVSEIPAPTGKFLVRVVIKLRDRTMIQTRNFHFHFAQHLMSEIKRRLELHRKGQTF